MTVSGTYDLRIDFANDGDLNGADNIADDIINARIERGFSTPLARMAYTGRATFYLQNLDQSYSPLLSSGRVPMRQVRFQMTFNGSTSTLFRGYVTAVQPASEAPGPPKRVYFHCVDASALMDLKEAAIAVQLGADAKTILTALVNAVYTSPVGLNMQNGINTFPISADRWSVDTPAGARWSNSSGGPTEAQISASSKIVDVCTSDWGRFFIDGQGRPTFVNRHDQLLDTAPRLTLDNHMHGMGHQRNADDIINIADVTYSPRVVGDVNEVLGTLSQGSAVKLEAGETQEFTLRFRDPSNPALDVGAYSLESPVSGTDFAATDDEAGEGTDKTSDMIPVVTLSGASSATIEVTNNDTAAIYIQKLQIRGRAVRTRREETATTIDSASTDEFEDRRLSVSAPLMSNRSQARLLADHLVELYKDEVERIEGLRIYGNRNTTFLSAVRDLELLEPIRVTEDHLGFSNFDGTVYQMVHNIRHPEYHELIVAIHAPYSVGGTICQLDETTFASNHVLVY